MKFSKTRNLLFILLAFSPILSILGAETGSKSESKTEETSSISSTFSGALEACKGLAVTAGTVGYKFAGDAFRDCVQKPAFGYVQSWIFVTLLQKMILEKIHPDEFTNKEKAGAGVVLAALYIFYKHYTGDDQPKIDMMPKTFQGFVLLLAERDSGLAVLRDFRYQLDTIKKDLATENKQGLELLALLYPDLIAALEPNQRLYLNDLIKQVTGNDTIVIPAKEV